MYKIAFLLITLLIGILAGHSKAFAESPLQPEATQPHTKTKGKLTPNPHRTDSTVISPRIMTALYQSDTGIVLNDIWIDWQRDNDGDGYHAKFNIGFDFDAPHDEKSIYVIGHIRGQEDSEDVRTLFQTEPYHIRQVSGTDAYLMTVLLTEGYPAAPYHITLSVYDANNDTLLHEFDGNDASLLYGAYLEDAVEDNPTTSAVAQASHIELYELAFSLYDDLDYDGYYTRLELSVDVDAPDDTRWIYGQLYLIDEYGHHHHVRTTQEFRVSHYNESDRYFLDIILDSGFEPQNYQIMMELYDADNHNLLLISHAPANAPAHMESLDWDSTTEVVIVEETHTSGSGGSLSILTWLALFLIGLSRLRHPARK